METSARQLTAEGKPDIWLVGAVHVGNKDYYQNLQRLLDSNELVMFEGVKGEAKPAEKKPTPAASNNKPVYKTLSDGLGLEFQLSAIDYTHKNWKNVDLTWEQMDKINKEAEKKGGGSSAYGNIKNVLDPNSSQAKALANMMDTATPGTKEALKLLIIKYVAAGKVSLDPATEKLIVDARNKVVIDELSATIKAEHAPKSVAVFYGAMHMPSMEKDLVTKFGYKLGKQQWFKSAEADQNKVDAQGQMLLNMFEKQMGKGSGGG